MSTKLKRSELLDEVKKLIKEHQITTEAIITDYEALSCPVDDGMITEINAADQTLNIAIKNLECESDLETIYRELEEIYVDEIDADKILPLLDKDEVKQFVQDDFDICVTCTDNNIRTKLEEFIKTEIYPYVLDQNKYTNL